MDPTEMHRLGPPSRKDSVPQLLRALSPGGLWPSASLGIASRAQSCAAQWHTLPCPTTDQDGGQEASACELNMGPPWQAILAPRLPVGLVEAVFELSFSFCPSGLHGLPSTGADHHHLHHPARNSLIYILLSKLPPGAAPKRIQPMTQHLCG